MVNLLLEKYVAFKKEYGPNPNLNQLANFVRNLRNDFLISTMVNGNKAFYLEDLLEYEDLDEYREQNAKIQISINIATQKTVTVNDCRVYITTPLAELNVFVEFIRGTEENIRIYPKWYQAIKYTVDGGDGNDLVYYQVGDYILKDYDPTELYCNVDYGTKFVVNEEHDGACLLQYKFTACEVW